MFGEEVYSPTLTADSELLQKAKSLIDQFFRYEYEHGAEPDDFLDLSRIGIAHTTTEEDIIPIQAYCDLVNFRIYTCLDVEEVIIREEQYAGLREMIDMVLPYLDFADLTYVDEDDLAKLNMTLADAYERAGDSNQHHVQDGPILE